MKKMCWKLPSRYVFVLLALAMAGLVPLSESHSNTAALAPGTVLPNGLHYQPWIKEHKQFSLKEILASAKAEGKGLAILFEEKGCPYCARLHAENFTFDDVTTYMTKHFDIIQIDHQGDRQVTMLDGKNLSERAFARAMKVTSTPTTLFMKQGGAENFRMPGFIPAAYYRAGYQYVVEKGPASGVGFIPWVKAFAKRAQENHTQ